MNKLLTALVSLTVFASFALAAPKLAPCSALEAGVMGGNYSIIVNASDFSSVTATNTGITFTNAVTAPVSVRFAGYVLRTPFDSSAETNTYSMTVSSGDTNSTTRWINAAQIAYDATPTVYGAFGSPDITVTVVTTNAAATVTGPVLDSQSVNVQLVTTIACTSRGAIASLDRGSLQLYFKILGKGW